MAMAENRINILLVEDDPEDVWVMRNLLGDRWDAPFQLAHVELLSAAIERCAEQRFDVVLLDLSLPDSRGLETFFAMLLPAWNFSLTKTSGAAPGTTTRGEASFNRTLSLQEPAFRGDSALMPQWLRLNSEGLHITWPEHRTPFR